MARVLIAGCGYVGGALGALLSDDGHEVFGLRRDPDQVPVGIRPVAADLARPETLGAIPAGIDLAVYCAGPDGPDEKAYRACFLDSLGNLLRVLREQGEQPRRIFFTSSTAVYGQRRGEWVDEGSVALPTRFTGEILLLAERLLHASGLPSTVLRLGGIYGPGRTRLVERVRAGGAPLRETAHFTNRIHRDDAAGALHHLMGLDAPDDLYLGVDDDPADEAAVLRWLAERLGARLAPVQSSGLERSGPDDSRRRAGSKRCRNRKLRDAGYALIYPSFREGYAELLETG